MSTRNKNKIILKCQSPICKKALGEVRDDGVLVTESTRSAIRTYIHVGSVECRADNGGCGTILKWDKSKIIKTEN